MAKDGTARGGPRPGAGRKPKKSAPLPAPDVEAGELPQVKDYMKDPQAIGGELRAGDVYHATVLWLRERGCEAAVNPQMVEQYAMMVARWIQCETLVSQYGLLAKHPTTGGSMASPFVSMGQAYLKQANNIWYQINQIVRERSA